MTRAGCSDRQAGLTSVRIQRGTTSNTTRYNTTRYDFLLKGFGRWPFAGGRAGRGAGVRKPRKEETAGRRGAVWLGATYGDLKVADGSAMWRRGRKAAGVIVGSEQDGLFRGRGCERRVWARRLERVCGGREDMVVLLRRAAGGEAKRRCVVGSTATVMRSRS